MTKLLRLAFQPQLLAHAVLRRVPLLPFGLKLALDLYPRPAYAFGLHSAALLASALGVRRFSAIEFGVAGGNGLVALEKIAHEVGRQTGTDISVYGFDSGVGMPAPLDYRDIPYFWQPGDFKMDAAALKARLSTAQLILGDVRETIGALNRQLEDCPVGFIAFDLDYYSSTVAALTTLDLPDSHLLPRVFCYFDDIISSNILHVHEYSGELLAISEFNATHETRKICKLEGLGYQRVFQRQWNECIYVAHLFEHPSYNNPVSHSMSQLPLAK